MATVFAFQAGNIIPNPGKSDWHYVLEFCRNEDVSEYKKLKEKSRQGFEDFGTKSLIEQLAKNHLQNQIDQLAIVAHGRPGEVLMSGVELPPATTTNLRDLSTYVRRGGMLSFVSCNAAQGPVGSFFLMKLSKELPDRIIVGLTIWGLMGSYGADYPENLRESKDGSTFVPGARRITAWSDYAKWAYNGAIVRVPYDEQKQLRGNRCANPHCPGHRDAHDRCPYKSWGQVKALLEYSP